MLYYLPLEPYRERYTSQLSARDTGWYERNWKKAGVEYTRISPDAVDTKVIRTGSVLDAVGRSLWSFDQIGTLLRLAQEGKITSRDVILFDDFWTPGIEALPYLFHQLNVRPKMYAYCWAQSVDEFDFTAGMAEWMRHFERGIGEVLDGIFVANTELKRKLETAQIGQGYKKKVHVVGLPFDSDEVMERMPVWYRFYMGDESVAKDYVLKHPPRKNQVVFSSRCDWEKQPEFFVRLFHLVRERHPEVTFVVTTSARTLRSNRIDLLQLLKNTAETNPNFVIKENQTKEQYYQTLCESKIQFNCAKQDWVSFTLLEASVAGCWPIYPYFRSFPETLNYQYQFVYNDSDLQDACNHICAVLESSDENWSPESIRKRAWIHERMDDTWLRMLKIMDVKFQDEKWDTAARQCLPPYIPFPETQYRRSRPAL